MELLKYRERMHGAHSQNVFLADLELTRAACQPPLARSSLTRGLPHSVQSGRSFELAAFRTGNQI